MDRVICRYYADEPPHGAKGERKDVKPKEFLYGEYSEKFDRLRKSRVQVSYHKYGPAAKNFGGACGRLSDGAAVSGGL